MPMTWPGFPPARVAWSLPVSARVCHTAAPEGSERAGPMRLTSLAPV
jgi:hypothetical protein